jgi:hypothetical protein
MIHRVRNLESELRALWRTFGILCRRHDNESRQAAEAVLAVTIDVQRELYQQQGGHDDGDGRQVESQR